MDDDKVKLMLNTVPGTKRTKRGVLFPVDDDGSFFHVLNTSRKEDSEGLTEDETFFISICPRKEILRLRSLRNAHDYLLYRRANAIAANPRYVRVFLERRARFEKSSRSWSLTQYYHSQDYYKKSFLNKLPRASANQVRGIPAGMALIQEATAVCRRTFVGDVILVSEGLQWFYYFMHIGLFGDLYEIPQVDRLSALLIAVRIMIGVEAIDFDLDPRGMLPEEIERSIQARITQQMAFTFGHEYGHIASGHLSEPNASEILVYNHKCEFEADAWAISAPQHNKSDIEVSLIASLAVMSNLHFLENALSRFGSKKLSVSDTHPCPKDRMASLWTIFNKRTSLPSQTVQTMLQNALSGLDALAIALPTMREDILTLYGSVYLPSYTKRILKDRIET